MDSTSPKSARPTRNPFRVIALAGACIGAAKAAIELLELILELVWKAGVL
jgi:hypothetical protein